MVAVKDIRRIAWSIFWKTSLAGLVIGYAAGFAFGFIVGFVGALAGWSQDITFPVIRAGSFAAGLGVSFLSFNFFLARAIGKRIGDKQLQLADSTAFGER